MQLADQIFGTKQADAAEELNAGLSVWQSGLINLNLEYWTIQLLYFNPEDLNTGLVWCSNHHCIGICLLPGCP